MLTRVILLGIPEPAKLLCSVANWNFEGDSFQKAQPLLDFVPPGVVLKTSQETSFGNSPCFVLGTW